MILLAEIELIQFPFLSDRDLNCHNNIQLFLRHYEKLRVKGDINSHYKVLGMKQTVE